MFTCNGPSTSGQHTHEFAFQAKQCYRLTGYYVAPSAPAPVPAFAFGSKANPAGPLSEPQFKYIISPTLGGDETFAKKLTYAQASNYINALIDAKKTGTTVAAPVQVIQPPPPPVPVRDDRLDMIEMLINKVPDGYYAVGDDPTRVDSLTFLRISRPKKNRLAGALKIQRVLGSAMGTRLEEYAVWWPSKRWSFYGEYDRTRASERTYTALMLLCADHHGAALLYAEHIGRCCRCNAQLTDERSRWNHIGPECEKYWPWVLDQIAETKGVFH